jgi:GT2 family glycosyltransferase
MKINYLQIHDYNLDISKRLNECVALLPNEWICLTDNDVLKFPSFADNIKAVLESDGVTYNDLIGTTTNRLRPTNPQVVNELFDEKNMDKHFQYADRAFKIYGTELEHTKLIAGSCMVFHKSLWEKVGGFDEDKIFFDKYFSYKVNDIGRCLIAKGVYTFHLYRWGSDNPVGAVHHLVRHR